MRNNIIYMMGIFIGVVFCFALLHMLNTQKAFACCERANDPIFEDWTDYQEEHCPNNYGYECYLRRCIGRVKTRCNLGVLCGPITGFSCLPNCFDDPVVYCNDSCNKGANISTVWQWVQIQPGTDCEPYLCFCQCNGLHAMKELYGDDCYED